MGEEKCVLPVMLYEGCSSGRLAERPAISAMAWDDLTLSTDQERSMIPIDVVRMEGTNAGKASRKAPNRRRKKIGCAWQLMCQL